METPKTAELADAAGISLSYASEIVNNKRDPSRSLAIHIFRKTGWRHSVIEGLSADQIDLLESIEPWRDAA
jgi:transcriptional regulator with XRE-family HTH domain